MFVRRTSSSVEIEGRTRTSILPTAGPGPVQALWDCGGRLLWVLVPLYLWQFRSAERSIAWRTALWLLSMTGALCP